MNAYLETSALLSWLLEEPEGTAVESILRQIRHLSTSQLTLAESRRALRRRGLPMAIPAQQRLNAIESRWNEVPVLKSILEQTGQAFPIEPVRTLEAIHLLTALELRQAVADLLIISLDLRVRENAVALGFIVLP